MTLTPEQQTAVDAAIAAMKNRDLFKIGGYAGTGKTTVAKYIAEHVKGCMPCAFTGKAAYRLTQKGLPATTIHKRIYEYAEKIAGKLRFSLRSEVTGDWFLIDEGSMIPEKVWQDINSFGLPILLLGDPGQLEPVGRDAKLMHECDVVLEQIHRQAAESGIIQFATDIRMEEYESRRELYDEGCGLTYPDVEINVGDKVKAKDLKWCDVAIVGFNRTRIRFNKAKRVLLGYEDVELTDGDRIIVLKNNREFGVFNGQMLTVDSVISSNHEILKAACRTDEGEIVVLPLWADQFNSGVLPLRRDDVVQADYGYAITCHKSQGSEWDNVVVVDEQCPSLWDARRWRYTACTRAAKSLRFFCKEGV